MRGLLTCMAVIAATPAGAQVLPRAPDGFDIGANVRLRYETIEGQARSGVPADEASTQLRTLIHATYRDGAWMVGGTLADSRALDVPARSGLTSSEIDPIEPIEAFVGLDLGDAARRHLFAHVTLGRQTAELRSRRLIARDDYRNTATSFTGARVDLADGERWNVTAFYFLPQQHLPEDAQGLRRERVQIDHEGFDTRLWGATAARPHLLGRIAGDIGVYRFEERDRPGHATRDRQLTTLSARLIAAPAPGAIDGEIEIMRQTGSISASLAPTAALLPVEAWFGHASLGYQWSIAWTPRLALDADYATGDRRNGHYGRFDTLYGMRRADFSPAGLYNAVTRSNVVALGPRLEVVPSHRLDAMLTIKKLWLDSARDAFSTTSVVDATGQSGHDAGWQSDARLRFWAIPKRLQLEADGVWLTKGRFLETAPNRTSDHDTLYLCFNASVFF